MCAERIYRIHMDMAFCNDDAAPELYRSFRPCESASRRAVKIPGLADNALYAKSPGVSHRNLYLSLLAARPQDDNFLESALGTNDGETLLARILSRLTRPTPICSFW